MSFFWKYKFENIVNEAPGSNEYERLKYAANFLAEKIKEKEKEKKKEQEQADLKKELADIHNRLVRDFNENPFSDKYETKTILGITYFIYTFENGEKLQINNEGELVIETTKQRTKYTLGAIVRNQFIETANKIQQKGKPRSKQKQSWYDSFFNESKKNRYFEDDDFDFGDDYTREFFEKYFKNDFGSRGNGSTDNSYKGSSTNQTNQKHPKWQIYQTLVITITNRKDHLSKLPKNHIDRTCLENELAAAVKRMEEMKKKYGF
jgi:hypothetical protein